MKKKILSIFLLFVVAFTFCVSVEVEAREISQGEAELIAYNWCEILRGHFKENVSLKTTAGQEITVEGGRVAYVFSFEPKGFVIISAEDYLPPVKFYTTSFDFGEHPQAVKFQKIIFNELAEIIEEVKKRDLDEDHSFASHNRAFVRFLRGYQKFLQAGVSDDIKEVEPLIKSKWGQCGAENLKCPVIDGYRAPSGCVATALTQIMNYHEWPLRGKGSHLYTLYRYNIHLSANFDHEYDWENMLDYYEHANFGTEAEREAISTLTYDVGVALEMGYNPTYSAVDPHRAIEALPKYFKYSDDIEFIFRFGYSSSEWFDLVKAQLDQGLPVAFTVMGPEDGHEVTIDGYRVVNQSGTVHINMGWYGIDDGYYSLDNVLDYDVLSSQAFILNIKPPNYQYIKAPENISAVCRTNRSLLMTEYHINITWDETPTGDENIEKYIIYRRYRKEANSKPEKIAEVMIGSERSWTFITSSFDRWEYDYTVIAVNLGNKSKNPEWVMPTMENQ